MRQGTELVGLGLVLCSVATAQTTFNTVHNHSVLLGWPDPGGGVGRSVWSVDSGFVVFAEQIESDGRGKPFTIRFDPNGIFASERWFNLAWGQDLSYGYSDPLTTHAPTVQALLTEFDDPNDSLNRLHALTFEVTGDTLSSNLISDSCWCGVHQTQPIEDGYLAVAGFNGLQAAFMLINPADGILLQAAYPDTYGAYCVDTLIGGGFLLAGNQYGGVPDGLWVMRLDSAGNQVWRRNFGGSSYAYDNVSAIQSQDGGIVATGSFMPLPGSWNSPQWNYFRKWDINGNVQWSKQYNQAQKSTTYDLEELPTGELVACGGESSHWGLLIKLEADGDLIWLRRYEHYTSNGSIHIPYDVEATSDGGFVMTGQARQGIGDSLPGLQMVWLIKVDSAGCLVPGCGNIGVEEVALGLEDALTVYPNPATDQVQVVLDLPQDLVVRGALQLVVVDALGRTVLEVTVGSPRSLQLDLSRLSAGVHYLHLRDESRWLSGTKLVVE